MKKARKRKRVILECPVCHHVFDDVYRTQHNRAFCSELMSQNKAIPIQDCDVPKNQGPMYAFLTKTAQSPLSAAAHQKDLTETDTPASNEMSSSADNNINMKEIEQQATDVDNINLGSRPSDPPAESGPNCRPTAAEIEKNFSYELSSDTDSGFIQSMDKEPLSWLTCAGELLSLVKDLTTASKLLEDVRRENHPLVVVFLTNTETETTRNIAKNALEVNM